MKYWVIGIVVIVIAFISVGYFVPLAQVSYATSIDYQDTEIYFEDERYQDTEDYTETEPYEENETYYESTPFSYKVAGTNVKLGSKTKSGSIYIGGILVSGNSSTTYFPICCVDITNTDTEAASFSVSVLLTIDNSGSYSSSTNKIIQGGETQTIEVKFQDVDVTSEEYTCKYTINPGTKSIEKTRTVTKYHDVIKTRLVTKTRQIEKQRPITKQRSETCYKKVPLFESWFNY
jgi:hypothetical protein